MIRGPQVSLPRRARHRARTYLSESPALYLPIARRRYPGPSPQVVGADTECVIDGYTRCASTFVVYAFQLAQPRPVRVAHHLHAAAQLLSGVRRQIPVLCVIREPRGAVLSQLVREPHVDLRDALIAYARFYERLMPCRDGIAAGDFPELTSEPGAVVRRLNLRFGTTFAEPVMDEDMLRECQELVTARSSLSPLLLGFESGDVSLGALRRSRADSGAGVSYGGAQVAVQQEVWVPSPERDRAKAALSAAWEESAPRLRERAVTAFREFLAAENLRPAAVG